MKIFKEKFKPGASKNALLIIAGGMWLGVGTMLAAMALHWLYKYDGNPWLFAVPGVITALIVHHFGFLKIVDKNLARISKLNDRPCVFSFISWKSYLTIIVMIVMGLALRRSPIPKQFLSVIYLGIGLALILSSIRYFRYLMTMV